ncbi:MAG: response regulator transcription factor [Planctomycetaceae bacterium]|jgi:DNA-binding NarL/FixJ family response regulator|nr:response regulator transcription factor [Planctomycetaceae bacterium]
MIHTIIIDPHPIVRIGIREALRGNGVDVVGESATAADAVPLLKRLVPDVLVTELDLPNENVARFLQSAAEHAKRLIPVIAFTSISLSTALIRFDNIFACQQRKVENGKDKKSTKENVSSCKIFDYILKTSPPQLIVQAIKAASSGNSPIPHSELDKFYATKSNAVLPLTKREIQVLYHIANGLSNREIGDTLQISRETVKDHITNIFQKTKVKTRTQIAVWGTKHGLVE